MYRLLFFSVGLLIISLSRTICNKMRTSSGSTMLYTGQNFDLTANQGNEGFYQSEQYENPEVQSTSQNQKGNTSILQQDHSNGMYNPTPAEYFGVPEKEEKDQFYLIPAVVDKRDAREYKYGYDQYGYDYSTPHSQQQEVTYNHNQQNQSQTGSHLFTPLKHFSARPKSSNNYRNAYPEPTPESDLFHQKDASRRIFNTGILRRKVGRGSVLDINPHGTEMHAMPSAAPLDRNGSQWTDMGQVPKHGENHENAEDYNNRNEKENISKSFTTRNPNTKVDKSFNVINDRKNYNNNNEKNYKHNQNTTRPPLQLGRSEQRSKIISPALDRILTSTSIDTDATGTGSAAMIGAGMGLAPLTETVSDTQDTNRLRNRELQDDINKEYAIMNIQDKLKNIDFLIERLKSTSYQYDQNSFNWHLDELLSEKAEIEKKKSNILAGHNLNQRLRTEMIPETSEIPRSFGGQQESELEKVSKVKKFKNFKEKVKKGFDLHRDYEYNEGNYMIKLSKNKATRESQDSSDIVQLSRSMAQSGTSLQRYERHTEKVITRGDTKEEIKTKEVFVHDARDNVKNDKAINRRLEKLLREKQTTELTKYENRRMVGGGEFIDPNKIADNLTDKIARNLLDYQRYITKIKPRGIFKNSRSRQDTDEGRLIELVSEDDIETPRINNRATKDIERPNTPVVIAEKDTSVTTDGTPEDGLEALTMTLKKFTSSFHVLLSLFPFFHPVLAFFQMLYSLVPQRFHIVVVGLELGSAFVLCSVIYRIYCFFTPIFRVAKAPITLMSSISKLVS